MKKLLSMVLVLLSVVTLAQKPKYLYIKQYKAGKVISVKQIRYPKADTIYVYRPTTVYKTKIKEVQVPKIEYKLVNVPTPPTALDTVAILQAYYPKNVHKDILILPEKQGIVTITDTISHNRLVDRSFVANIRPKTVTQTVEVPAPKVREWYLGPELTTNFNTIYNWYGANVLLKNKSNNIFKFGAGVTMRTQNSGPSPFISVGAYIKVK